MGAPLVRVLHIKEDPASHRATQEFRRDNRRKRSDFGSNGCSVHNIVRRMSARNQVAAMETQEKRSSAKACMVGQGDACIRRGEERVVSSEYQAASSAVKDRACVLYYLYEREVTEEADI